jgi:hypothetical protein
VENPGWDKVKDELAVADADRVAGVMPALVARYQIKVRRKYVYNLALTLVAPLCADHYDVLHAI